MTAEKKQELVQNEESRELATPADNSAAMISMIERAATNPDVDVEKMERLYGMYEKIEAKKAESEFHSAMSRAQKRMGRVSADAVNPQTKSRYASYAALDRVLRPIYTDEGFALSFDEADGAPDGCMRVVCHVSHEAGHSRTHHKDMPIDGLGAKGNAVMTTTHARGSAQSYGMRYLLKAIFNVAVGEDDDDGVAADQPETITSKQVGELTDHISAAAERTGDSEDAVERRFLAWLNKAWKSGEAKELSDIPANLYDRCVSQLKSVGGQQ